MVHDHTVALHEIDGVPSFTEVSVAVGYSGVHEAVVGDVIRGMASCLHLLHQFPGTGEVPATAVTLHQRVVGDDVNGAVCLLHLLHQCPGPVHVACGDADIQHAVVCGDVKRHTCLAELCQHAEGPIDVLVTPGCADQRHVVLNVQAGRPLGEFTRKVGASTLHGELHEAAVHHGVGLKAVRTNLIVESASLVVHAAVGVDLHQSAVDSNGHAATRLRELDHLLRKAQELRLCTARQQTHTEALANADTSLLHLLEELNSMHVAVQCAELQQGVVGTRGEWLLRLAAYLLNALGKIHVIATASILHQQGNCLWWEREVLIHLVEDLEEAAGITSDAQKLRHRKWRYMQAVVLHLEQPL
mmetsp:Transcript_17840/g.55820  ORF Transcript_17840/g.55820 Transcript_17840/m.55820 type:complete len:358 (-) Transcript_17840:211-1284(-)